MNEPKKEKIKKTAAFSRNPDCVFRVLDGKAIIALPRTMSTYLLNDTAARVWELLEGRRTPSEIAEAMWQEYDAELPALEKDIAGILRELEGESVVLRESK